MRDFEPTRIDNPKIRNAASSEADELLAIRRDAILSLAEDYGRDAAERWANAAPADRAARAIASGGVRVAELDAKVAGWVEVNGETIESLYVRPAAARHGVGSALLAHAEGLIHASGGCVAHLDASPNAVAFYARRGYEPAGEIKANNSRPMRKRLGESST